jgi:hypothetical protein
MHRKTGSFLIFAALLTTGAAFAQTAPGLQQVETDQGTELQWGQRPSFHVTTHQVDDLRLVPIEGSRRFSVVWTETDDRGATSSHYAISLDGRTFATVRETSYEIMMRRDRFDPLDRAPAFRNSVSGPGGDVYLVQFATQVLEEYRDALESRGASVYGFVSNHTHLVRMDAGTRQAVEALPFVRWVGPYHPEFRLEEELLAGLATGDLGEAKYNVMVFERGLDQKALVAQKIAAIGGTPDEVLPDGFLLEATLSAEGLAIVAGFDEVQWIDRWSAPETDMNISRNFGGANYVEGMAGFKGEGVRAEVSDSGGIYSNNPEFQTNNPTAGMPGIILHGGVGGGSHGTSCFGINFAHGVSANARGIVPWAQGIGAGSKSGATRYTHTAQLVNPTLVYQAVYQSNSWGNSQTQQYTSASFELDDIIFINDIVICQSQSNTGNKNSRPQAWAKNIVAVGGIKHKNTLTRADDQWTGGGSIGPAADGRLKPDLSNFYDNIFTTSSASGYTFSFGGTSGATPITAGHFGLFFQMWHAGIFGNPTSATVFESRPHSTTAKAMLINTANSYNFSGTGHDLTRVHQGWGTADVQKMYDDRAKTFIVNETDVLAPLDVKSYGVVVNPGEPELKVTMVYLDRPGTVSAAQHRQNDLSLLVTSPSGATYWGNAGLAEGNWSVAGTVPNTKDTVENVFIDAPETGTWTVDVIGAEIVVDTHVETMELDADYALVVRGHGGIVPPCKENITTYCTAKPGLTCGTPAISTFGSPSSTSTSAFLILAGPARTNRSGILLYSDAGRDAQPFSGGTLCIKTPLKRSVAVNSGGVGTCDGEFGLDMNAFAQGTLGGNPAAFLTTPGTQINCQWWGRDTLSGAFLSDGLEYTLCN